MTPVWAKAMLWGFGQAFWILCIQTYRCGRLVKKTSPCLWESLCSKTASTCQTSPFCRILVRHWKPHKSTIVFWVWRSRPGCHLFWGAQLSDELWPSTVDEPADVNYRAWSVLDGASMFIICHLVFGTEPALWLQWLVGWHFPRVCPNRQHAHADCCPRLSAGMCCGATSLFGTTCQQLHVSTTSNVLCPVICQSQQDQNISWSFWWPNWETFANLV